MEFAAEFRESSMQVEGGASGFCWREIFFWGQLAGPLRLQFPRAKQAGYNWPPAKLTADKNVATVRVGTER